MSETKEPLLDFETTGRVTVATIRTSSVLSASNVADFGAQVLDYVGRHAGLALIINFEHVDYLSSAVLTELLRINKKINEVKGRLHLCAVSKTIREIFTITNLDRVFVLHEDGKDAGVRRMERSLDVAASEAAWVEPKST